MKKQTLTIFGKKNYLLGTDKNGRKLFLVAPSWDCGWYWGFGYIETYTNNRHPERSRDIASHNHFNYLFGTIFGTNCTFYDGFKNIIIDSTLSDNELWKLCDYMETFYCLNETAEVLKRGYSHYDERAKLDIVKDEAYAERINKVILPELFKHIEDLFKEE